MPLPLGESRPHLIHSSLGTQSNCTSIGSSVLAQLLVMSWLCTRCQKWVHKKCSGIKGNMLKVWVGECSFWYRPTRVVPDQRPLNGRCPGYVQHTQRYTQTRRPRNIGTNKLHLHSVHAMTPNNSTFYYRVMLCIRSTNHGSVSVCPSQVEVLVKWLNIGSQKQHHTIAQGL